MANPEMTKWPANSETLYVRILPWGKIKRKAFGTHPSMHPRTHIMCTCFVFQVACETEDDGRLPTTLFSSRLNCGYFLFAVAPVTVATDSSHRESRSGSGLGGGLRELDTLTSRAVADQHQHQHRFLRVYLKPSFCLAGLQAVLGVPGTKVFLRDVEVGHDGKESNACCAVRMLYCTCTCVSEQKIRFLIPMATSTYMYI